MPRVVIPLDLAGDIRHKVRDHGLDEEHGVLGNNENEPHPTQVVSSDVVHCCFQSQSARGYCLPVSKGLQPTDFRVEDDHGNVRHHRDESHGVEDGEPGS